MARPGADSAALVLVAILVVPFDGVEDDVLLQAGLLSNLSVAVNDRVVPGETAVSERDE